MTDMERREQETENSVPQQQERLPILVKDDRPLSYLDIMLGDLGAALHAGERRKDGDKVRLSRHNSEEKKTCVLSTDPSASEQRLDCTPIGTVIGKYDDNDRESDRKRETIDKVSGTVCELSLDMSIAAAVVATLPESVPVLVTTALITGVRQVGGLLFGEKNPLKDALSGGSDSKGAQLDLAVGLILDTITGKLIPCPIKSTIAGAVRDWAIGPAHEWIPKE